MTTSVRQVDMNLFVYGGTQQNRDDFSSALDTSASENGWDGSFPTYSKGFALTTSLSTIENEFNQLINNAYISPIVVQNTSSYYFKWSS